jgi:peptidoglycan DL-endopeptidase CwlO
MIDPTTAIARVQQLAATMSGAGQELATAGPGEFESVLTQISAAFEAVSDPSATAASAQSSSGSTAGEGTPGSTVEAAGLLSASNPDASSALMSTGSPVSGAATGVTGQQVVSDAEQYLGVPYVWGGTSPSGFDCSGLVQHVYGELGVQLPRTSEEQANVGTPVTSLADAQPGDLVFFAGSDGTASSPGHVGIYIGNGQMIDAPHTGANVRIESVGQPVAIRRILPDSGPSPVLSSQALTGAVGSASATSGSSDAQLSALGVPADLQNLFTSAGQRYGISPTLLAAVAKQESGFQPSAVSSAGAEGIMQLMPGTAAGLGVNPYVPAQAIDGAAQMLSGYLNQYGGSVPLTLAAYNAGPGAVAEYGGVPPYAQTQNYVTNITSMLAGATAQ